MLGVEITVSTPKTKREIKEAFKSNLKQESVKLVSLWCPNSTRNLS